MRRRLCVKLKKNESGRGQAVQTQNKTKKTPSVPRRFQAARRCIGIQKRQLRAWNLRGRARGLFGFVLCLDGLPPSQLVLFKRLFFHRTCLGLKVSKESRLREKIMFTGLMSKLLLVTLSIAATASSAFAQNDMSRFIKRSGDKLMEGDKEYRFISFNIPNLHLVEDNMTFEATNEWRFPDEFEITDALTTIKQMGGRVARTYVVSICKKSGPNPIPCHVKRPGEFNEEAFRALDKVLEIANRVGVRVIIPMVDNWKWWGGIDQYAEYRGKPGSDFWTDPEIIDDFKQTLNFLINRRNTYTGSVYKDDKAILAWETGNEILPPYSWTKQIARYIKSLDANHLIWDGFYIGSKEIQTDALNDPNIDVVSSHHYPAPNKGPAEMVADIKQFREQIGAKKVYVVGEFGFIPPDGIMKVLDAVISEDLSGAMIWSLRFHNRDGGFYWHSEPASASLYNPYHYPGFPSGEGWNETATLKVMRTKAFEIQGLKVPGMEVLAPPKRRSHRRPRSRGRVQWELLITMLKDLIVQLVPGWLLVATWMIRGLVIVLCFRMCKPSPEGAISTE